MFDAKKIIALLLALVTLFSLASCTGKGDGGETAEETLPPDPAGDNLSAAFYETDRDGNSVGFRIEVTDNYVKVFSEDNLNSPFQSLPHTGVDNLDYAVSGILFEDYNFDGYTDFAVPRLRENDLQYYGVFLWSPGVDMFYNSAELSVLADLAPVEDYIQARELNSEGEIVAVKYFWDGENLEEESVSDDDAKAVLAVAKVYLGSEDVKVSYISDDLIDNKLCRLYTVNLSGNANCYIAVNYSDSEFFTSDFDYTYYRLNLTENSVTKGDVAYKRLEYLGDMCGYLPVHYEALTASQKDFYDKMKEKAEKIESFNYDSKDAEAAFDALMLDCPLLCAYLKKAPADPSVIDEENVHVVKSVYFYPWDEFSVEEPDSAVLLEKIEEYKEKIKNLALQMPSGLVGAEKYYYLAEKLQISSLEEHSHDAYDRFKLLLPGATEKEKYARTFSFLCDEAGLYCSLNEDASNEIDIFGEKSTVSVYEVSNIEPGTENWINTFTVTES